MEVSGFVCWKWRVRVCVLVVEVSDLCVGSGVEGSGLCVGSGVGGREAG